MSAPQQQVEYPRLTCRKCGVPIPEGDKLWEGGQPYHTKCWQDLESAKEKVHIEAVSPDGDSVYLDIPSSLWKFWKEHPHMSLTEFLHNAPKAITVLENNHVDARETCYICGNLIPEGEEQYGGDGTPYHAKCYETAEKVEMIPLSKVFVDAIRKYHLKKGIETEAECIIFLARMGMEREDEGRYLKEQFASIHNQIAELKKTQVK